MSFIKSRLRRLEDAVRGGRCPECHLPPDGPGYTIYSDDEQPEDPDARCPRCGRRLWYVIEVMLQRHEEGVRAFVAATKQEDRQLLEANRASVGLPPLTPEQLADYGLEGTAWGEGA